MGFSSGTKVLPDIIDDIADGLINSSANWTEGDSSWDTSDRSMANNARRCLKYTGDTHDIFLALEIINQTNGLNHYSSRRSKGLRVTFSAGWDYSSNNYPAGSHEMQTFIQTLASDTTSPHPQSDMATVQFAYWLWIDTQGFSLMAEPEPTSENRQGSFICIVERMTSKEYNDGLTNFYCWNRTNNHNQDVYNGARTKHILRPFAYQSGHVNRGIMWWRDTDTSRHALKSIGNGKVYFVRPVVCNSTDNMTPIYQSQHMWMFTQESGLVDGDVVAVDGATTKYLCKSISSPNSNTRLNFAIKYVE